MQRKGDFRRIGKWREVPSEAEWLGYLSKFSPALQKGNPIPSVL
ncbi:hypothetical protein QBE54_11025 [Thermatribacter velox]|uniref:Uncharacterized protein n=1 Tax=Thermatribacter velox TaxID=3039681 RepID=A0ABZ2YAR5_9BACT